MRKIDQYRSGMEFCLANASKAPFKELRALWLTLADDYAFLATFETGPNAGKADGIEATLDAQGFMRTPTDARTRP